jgi:hypothetical protein
MSSMQTSIACPSCGQPAIHYISDAVDLDEIECLDDDCLYYASRAIGEEAYQVEPLPNGVTIGGKQVGSKEGNKEGNKGGNNVN